MIGQHQSLQARYALRRRVTTDIKKVSFRPGGTMPHQVQSRYNPNFAPLPVRPRLTGVDHAMINCQLFYAARNRGIDAAIVFVARVSVKHATV